MAFNITSTAFEYGKPIPATYTCDGDDVSPPLRWDEAPKGTVTYALIMEDPDAPGGVFTHWIMYNIPADVHHLEKIVPIQKHLDNKAMQGQNSFGKIGYRGPCPPRKLEHQYFFRLYALKKKLPPESANTRESFFQSIKGQILGEAEYMGVYKKKPVNTSSEDQY